MFSLPQTMEPFIFEVHEKRRKDVIALKKSSKDIACYLFDFEALPQIDHKNDDRTYSRKTNDRIHAHSPKHF